MRNLKRVLSLALALMMALSLMAFTGSASAAESTTIPVASELYPDYDQTNYPEAVDVITALRIVEGADGMLVPDGVLKRSEATTIAARLLLGVNAAATLPNVDTYTGYKDVDSVGHWAAPYIAFCDNQGIVSGVGGGNFDPDGQLTGVAFGKVILTVLGYDADKEGLKGDNWATNVTIALANAGISVKDSEGNSLNLSKPITREQAMEMTFQALQAALVEYPTNTINGAAMATRNGATYVTSALARDQRINDRKLTGNSGNFTVEFAEKYFPELWLSGSTTTSANSSSVYRTDVFGRPAHTWTYKTHDIDTYTDDDLFIDEFTGGVTNAEMSQTLGYSRISDYVVSIYVDGALQDSTATDAIKENLTKTSESNKNVTGTGNGVKTEVYVDHNPIYKSGTAMTGEITIVIINTWLAEVTATDTLKVYIGTQETGTDFNDFVIKTKTALGADASLSGFNKGDMVQVTMAADDHASAVNSYKDYSVESVKDVEKVTDATITAYTLQSETTTNDITGDETVVVRRLSTMTADGTKYNAANKAFYDANVLYNYNEDRSELTEATFELYLTDDGFVLGVKQLDTPNNYIFVVNWENDTNFADVTSAIDRAAIITTSGQMKIVNITDSSVKKYDTIGTTTKWWLAIDPNGDGNTADHLAGYPINTSKAVNTWYTYTIDSDGTYVLLKEVDKQGSFAAPTGTYINNKNISLGDGTGGSERVYGNDNSTYITVETKDDTTWISSNTIINTLRTTTGIKNTNINPKAINTTEKNTFYMYDASNFVTYAVVVGEAKGTDQMVYFTSGVTGREVKDANGKTTHVGYKAILNGEEREVFVLDSVATAMNPRVDQLFTAEIDSNGYITRLITTNDTYAMTAVDAAVNTMSSEVGGTNTDGYAQATAEHNTQQLSIQDKGHSLYVRSEGVAAILTGNPEGWVRIDNNCAVFLKSNNSYKALTYEQFWEQWEQDAAAAAANGKVMYAKKVTAICETAQGTATTLIVVESTETLEPYPTPTTPPGDVETPAGTVGGEEVKAIKVGGILGDTESASDNGTGQAKVKNYLNSQLPGTYQIETKYADMRGNADENLVLVFRTESASQDATLVISKADGTPVYYEETTGNHFTDAGGHFFFVQVLDSTNDGTLLNAGTGTMKTTPLVSGDYTWTITTTDGGRFTGSFTIGG